MNETSQELKPDFAGVQKHYDLSDDFFALFLDPSMTYSCAYYERDDMTLEQAQTAKIDLALSKLDLRPGMRLLDIGCGWGSAMRRAAEKYDVDVVGLTLSRNQFDHVSKLIPDIESARSVEVRLQGWESFDEPVDAIVSIGAFEHFKRHRYGAFFERCLSLLPAEARMLLHTIVISNPADVAHLGLQFGRDDMDFVRFIIGTIFPGGQLAYKDNVGDKARASGFTVEREQPLGPHYARTLDAWAHNLASHREAAVAVASEQIYDTYARYLEGCAERFRDGRIDVVQYTLSPTRGGADRT